MNDLQKKFLNLFGKDIATSLKPSFEVLGQGISGVLYWIFHKPIEYKIIREAVFKNFTEQIAEGMREIPRQNRDSSKYGLVLETLQNSVYQLNEKELRKLFANLVTSLADKRKNNNITPRYVYILSQLGLKDALLLKDLSTQDNNRLYYVREATTDDKEGEISSKRVLYLSKTDKIIDNIDTSMNILESLGIIKVTGTLEIALDNENSTLKTRNRLISYFNNQLNNGLGPSLNLKLLNFDTIITSFGREFLNCVVRG